MAYWEKEDKEEIMSNYPPGVTGNEFAIAGPDYERESEIVCPECGGSTFELGYRRDRWLECENNHRTDLDPFDDGPDPDRKHDERRLG